MIFPLSCKHFDIDRFKKGAELLTGKHDFRTFMERSRNPRTVISYYPTFCSSCSFIIFNFHFRKDQIILGVICFLLRLKLEDLLFHRTIWPCARNISLFMSYILQLDHMYTGRYARFAAQIHFSSKFTSKQIKFNLYKTK